MWRSTAPGTCTSRTHLITGFAGCRRRPASSRRWPGTGKKGFAGDGGIALNASLNEPYGVEVDAHGDLYIVDRMNYCVRKVDAKTGAITTVAGTGGKSGYAGDCGKATDALLVEPNGICLDGKGKLYIADVAGHRVRVVDLKTGTIFHPAR